jgi:hypothetical protein
LRQVTAFADAAEAELGELAQNLLDRDLGALGPAAQDFRNSCRTVLMPSTIQRARE